MASNVFGNLITNETLKELPKYIGKKLTKRDKAKIAMQMKNAENKDVNARQYVEKLKREWGVGVSTICLVYNTSGDTITLAGSNDWLGHLGPATTGKQSILDRN